MPDEQWEHLNDWLGVPESVQDRFERQCSDDTRKRESLQYWLHNKPLPSWKCVAKALFLIGEFRVRKEVERKYLKSEAVCMVACYCLVDRYCMVEIRMEIAHASYGWSMQYPRLFKATELNDEPFSHGIVWAALTWHSHCIIV